MSICTVNLKSILNKRSAGFSLIEVLIAFSILSSFILVINKQASSVSKIDDIHSELSKRSMVKTQVETLLKDKRNCEINFSFDDNGTASLRNRDKLVILKNGTQDDFLSVGEFVNKNGRDNLIISSIDVEQTRFHYHFLILKLSRKNSNNTYTNIKPIRVVILTTFDDKTRCSTTYETQLDNFVNVVALKSCKGPFKSVRSEKNSLKYECKLPSSELGSSKCEDDEFLTRIYLKSKDRKLTLETECRKKSPCDKGEIAFFLNSQIKCKKKCTTNQIPILLNNNLVCKNISCPIGKYLKGLDHRGSVICNDIIETKKKCLRGPKLVVSNGSVEVLCN